MNWVDGWNEFSLDLVIYFINSLGAAEEEVMWV